MLWGTVQYIVERLEAFLAYPAAVTTKIVPRYCNILVENHSSNQQSSQCGPQASSTNILRELVRNVNSQAYPRPTESELPREESTDLLTNLQVVLIEAKVLERI